MTGFAPSGQLTRRTLLLAGAGAAAAAAIPDIALAAKKKALSKSHLDRAAWEPFVGSQLFVRNRGFTPVPVTLLKVGDLGPENARESYKERSFYLVFRGPADAPLAADTHLIKVPGIGKVKVWFSHVYQGEGAAWEYVAVFANSRIRQRPRKKPRTKGSKKQGRRNGEKAETRKTKKKDAPKAERREAAPKAKPEPAPAETAPEPQPPLEPQP